MAIQMDYAASDNRLGFTYQNAYYQMVWAITKRTQDTDPKFVAELGFKIYGINNPTYDADGNGTQPFDMKILEAPIADVEAATGATFLDKCYNYAMSHSDFSGATAV